MNGEMNEMNEMNEMRQSGDQMESDPNQPEYDPRPWEEREDMIFRDDTQGGSN